MPLQIAFPLRYLGGKARRNAWEVSGVSQSGQRLVSIDFWRGFALLTIFINHIPGHVFGAYTYRNFGFSDAAELFVFLAGVSAAFAYLRPFSAGEGVRTTARVWMRAFTLYTSHLVLVVMSVVVVGGFVVLTGDERMLEWMHLDIIPQYPLESMVGIGMLTYQPGYLNILPLYVGLLLLAPVLLLLARRSLLLALGASLALYLVTQLFHFALPVWPGRGGWFFNPLAWQFLFTCGLATGALIDRGLRSSAHRVLDVVAPLYLVGALGWAVLGYPVTPDLSPVPPFLWDFDKTNLALPRILHVLALVYCVSRLPLEAWLKKSQSAATLILMGRHALPVFCLGTVLSLGAQVLRPLADGALAVDLLIVAAGFSLQWSLAWALEWQARGRKPALASPTPATQGATALASGR